MKNFIRKTIGIRKETSTKNAGLFSGLLHKSDWHNTLINKYISSLLHVMEYTLLINYIFMLIFI